MKKITLSILAVFLFSSSVLAAPMSETCHELEGLWLGKFSYKDPSLCQLKYPELCNKVSMAIGVKFLAEDNLFVADIYPQRGVAGSLKMVCNNGRLTPLPDDPNVPPGTKITFQCDEQDNCVSNYEDFRLKAMLVKMWTEDVRV